MKLYGKHTEDVANRIIGAFKAPDTLPKALAPIFIQRNDDIPCRKWSWHNQLITALSGTVDARGFRQWETAGRKVSKGTHAIWILAPCTKRISAKDEAGEDKPRTVVYGFRAIPVFAIEDTEGDALPDNSDEYKQFFTELPVLEVAESWGITVDGYTHTGNAPLGYYSHGASGNQAIMLGVENLSTWAHELVHAADNKLNNLSGSKSNREIVAELGGAILLECLGQNIDSDLGGAYDYVKSYAALEKINVVQACVKTLDRTCNCVKLILETAETLQSVAV